MEGLFTWTSHNAAEALLSITKSTRIYSILLKLGLRLGWAATIYFMIFSMELLFKLFNVVSVMPFYGATCVK